MENKKVQPKKSKKNIIDIKKIGVDIDKNEYREIVTSNTNFPEKSYYKRDFYD